MLPAFPRRGRHFMVSYALVGWNAHQTLAMLLTRRMERLGLKSLGFNASDYMLIAGPSSPVGRLAARLRMDPWFRSGDDRLDRERAARSGHRAVAVAAFDASPRHGRRCALRVPELRAPGAGVAPLRVPELGPA